MRFSRHSRHVHRDCNNSLGLRRADGRRRLTRLRRGIRQRIRKSREHFRLREYLHFAFATLIGWSYYGRRGLEYLLGAKSAKIYNIIYAAAVFVGCVADLELVWELSDLANALMAVPNLISLCLLSGEATKELKKTYHN